MSPTEEIRALLEQHGSQLTSAVQYAISNLNREAEYIATANALDRLLKLAALMTTDPEVMREWTDAELLAKYHASEAEADDPELTAMCAEIQRRELDL